MRYRAGSGNLLNFTVTNARSAYTHALAGAFHERANGLQIDVPAPLSDVVSVTYAITELRPAAAHFTNLCHTNDTLLIPFSKI